MLFLKQIRANGFKSFAELTVLDFTSDMIGVVGPNGSGKSNITDAIRWALGEQSAKSLRGGNLDDVVFSGSADKVGVDVAEVTLVFDNQNHLFGDLESSVVEITRRFNKKTRDSDYFINGQRVKMRDVQDIALETGLTKSSIAIISQGTISQFTETKPEQRREIFDEAAGVAKYKKRKREASTKLIRAMENYNRLNDIAAEIGRRLPNLERQSKKALLYKEKIEDLKQFEVTILATDVQKQKVRIDELTDQKLNFNEKIKTLTNEINTLQQEFDQILNESSTSEYSMSDLNQQYHQIIGRLANLKVKKMDVENREKAQSIHSLEDEIKAKQIQKHYDELRINLQAELDKQNDWMKNLHQSREKSDYLTNKYNQIHVEIEAVRQQQRRLEIEQENNQRQKSNNFYSGPNAGVQAIMGNQTNLRGVVGTLLSLVKVAEEFQIAISVVAAASMQSIVMQSTSDVKKAVEFLKYNQAGRATFLPLDSLNPSTIMGMQRDAIEQQPGFLGFANNLVTIDSQYQKALDYALGTVIVVEDYDAAISLAKTINYRYNLVTLEGERILPHGAIVGGKTRNQNLFAQVSQEKGSVDYAAKLAELETVEVNKTQELNSYKIENDKVRDQFMTLQANLRVSRDLTQQMNGQIQELSEDYKILTGQSLVVTDENAQSTELESVRIARELAKLEVNRDKIQVEINNLSSFKNKYAERQREVNCVVNQKRGDLGTLKDQQSKVLAELNSLEIYQKQYLQKLLDSYDLTTETVLAMEVPSIANEPEVRARIKTLTQELGQIGQVNLDSIAEYNSEKERFEYYEQQTSEIHQAVEQLETIIQDIDVAMETQFKKVVDDVNLALPGAFQKLFGGGTAKLIYTQPDNILETGIDIQVNPPGKKISNLNLLSGGEKSLVALSVLFSILKVRPLPLVILDEAEAPLDPANVERFARYIKLFTDQTQFIVVTHREGTMENCDVLFGVTMETKGITKIVKIKLVDAKQLAINEQAVASEAV